MINEHALYTLPVKKNVKEACLCEYTSSPPIALPECLVV